MSQRILTLVFKNSKPRSENEIERTALQSVRCRMLRADSLTPSRAKDSPFLLTMRQLEATSQAHAKILMDLAKDILDERDRKVWNWSPLE